MTSQSENSVSVEVGELLELLNALEAQDSRPLENFATLERLLAAGKVGSAESSSDHHQSDDDHSDVETQSEVQVDVGSSISYADERYADESYADKSDEEGSSPREELIARRPDWQEDEAPQAEIENRLAVHIIQGLRKSIMDRTS